MLGVLYPVLIVLSPTAVPQPFFPKNCSLTAHISYGMYITISLLFTTFYWNTVDLQSCVFLLFCFLGLHLWHMEVPTQGVESELQLPAYTPATTMQDLSCICDLCQSSRQCQILNPLSEARDRTLVLMYTSWLLFCCTTTGTPKAVLISGIK